VWARVKKLKQVKKIQKILRQSGGGGLTHHQQNHTYLKRRDRRLVNLPTTDLSSQQHGWRPIPLSKFLSTQRTQLSACKKAILDEWLEEVVSRFVCFFCPIYRPID
jgi:hypothetical protein|tara:strand:- start:450 stop:767 length:318 start_codon:yes stop_codon:yes gene_type:complete